MKSRHSAVPPLPKDRLRQSQQRNQATVFELSHAKSEFRRIRAGSQSTITKNEEDGDEYCYTIQEIEDDLVDDDEYEYYDHVESHEHSSEPPNEQQLTMRRIQPLLGANSYRRSSNNQLLPITVSIPTLLHSVSSKLSNLINHPSLKNNDFITSFKSSNFSFPTGSTAITGVVLSAWILIMMFSGDRPRWNSIPFVKTKGRDNSFSEKKKTWKDTVERNTGEHDIDEPGVNAVKYGDYSEGYPGEDSRSEDYGCDGDFLDLKESVKDSTVSREKRMNGTPLKRFIATRISLIQVLCRWMWTNTAEKIIKGIQHGVRMESGKNHVTIDYADNYLSSAELVTANGYDELRSLAAFDTNKDAVARTENLQQQLDVLTDSHESLEQEFEASLAMLHEARLELRQVKSQQQTKQNNLDNRDDLDEETRKKQIELTINKLEAKYKQQMNDQIDQIRSQIGERVRSEMKQEYDAKLKAESERLAVELKRNAEESFLSGPDFHERVEEAASKQIEGAIADAVQRTIERERQKAREEMKRVRIGIQNVLERERRLMKEQVIKVTGQVKEWVKRQQLEQLQKLEMQTRIDTTKLPVSEEDQFFYQGGIADDGNDGNLKKNGMRTTPRNAGGDNTSSRKGGSYTGSSFYEGRLKGARTSIDGAENDPEYVF